MKRRSATTATGGLVAPAGTQAERRSSSRVFAEGRSPIRLKLFDMLQIRRAPEFGENTRAARLRFEWAA
jgi:hypothetical protein